MPAPLPAPLAAIHRRLADLQAFQLARLRECTDARLQKEYADEVRGDVESVRRGIEDAEVWIEEDAVNEQWAEELERCRAELARTRTQYREALVHSSASIRNAARYELLPALASGASKRGRGALGEADDAGKGPRDRGAGGDELQGKTNEVTDALRRTTQLMRIELDKSVMATQLLDESSQTLRSTHTLYDTYASLLSTSASLVRAIEHADWYDRLIILCTLAFFALCVGWIVKRRVLDRVAGGVGWWIGGSWRLVTGQWRGRGKAGGMVAGKAGKVVAEAVRDATTAIGAGQDAAAHGASRLADAAQQAASSAGPPIGHGASMGIDALRQRAEL